MPVAPSTCRMTGSLMNKVLKIMKTQAVWSVLHRNLPGDKGKPRKASLSQGKSVSEPRSELVHPLTPPSPRYKERECHSLAGDLVILRVRTDFCGFYRNARKRWLCLQPPVVQTSLGLGKPRPSRQKHQQ
jgi:hypothetical protein